MSRTFRVIASVACLGLLGCSPEAPLEPVASTAGMSFEDFKASLNTTEEGLYVIHEDLLVSEALLEKFHRTFVAEDMAAIVGQNMWFNDIVWSSEYRRNLSYCIGSSFTPGGARPTSTATARPTWP